MEDEFLEAVSVDHVEAVSGLDAGDHALALVRLADPVLAVLANLEVTVLLRLLDHLVYHSHVFLMLLLLRGLLDLPQSIYFGFFLFDGLSLQLGVHLLVTLLRLLAGLDLFNALVLGILLAMLALEQVLSKLQIAEVALRSSQEHLQHQLEVRVLLHSLVPALVARQHVNQIRVLSLHPLTRIKVLLYIRNRHLLIAGTREAG